MKRTDFSKESEIVDENFGDYIKKYGGKAAGLFLARKILSTNQFLESTLESPIVPDYSLFKTSLYDIAERILKEKLPEPLKRYTQEHPNDIFVQEDEEALLITDISRILFNEGDFTHELEEGLRSSRRKFSRESNFRKSKFLRASKYVAFSGINYC